MPTKRIRISRLLKPGLTETQWALLIDEPLPDAGLAGDLARWSFQWDKDDAPPWCKPTGRQLWAEHGPEILARWIVERPGTRPSCWWKFDAPICREDGEDETAYLRRHHLLSPGEIRALGR